MALNQSQESRQQILKSVLLAVATIMCLILGVAHPSAAASDPESNCLANSPVYRLTFANTEIAYFCISKRMSLFFGLMIGKESEPDEAVTVTRQELSQLS